MASKMKTVRLNVTVVTAKGSFPPGEEVSLPEAEADRLVALHGAAPRIISGALKTPSKPKGEALVKAIVAAIDALDPDDEDNFTASGKPNVAALEKVLGFDISAEDRDKAVASLSDTSSSPSLV